MKSRLDDPNEEDGGDRDCQIKVTRVRWPVGGGGGERRDGATRRELRWRDELIGRDGQTDADSLMLSLKSKAVLWHMQFDRLPGAPSCDQPRSLASLPPKKKKQPGCEAIGTRESGSGAYVCASRERGSVACT